MAPIIQMIYVGNDNYLFLKGFNPKGELVFRTSLMPKYLQNEKIVIDEQQQTCYTNLYHFHVGYLGQIANEIIGGW